MRVSVQVGWMWFKSKLREDARAHPAPQARTDSERAVSSGPPEVLVFLLLSFVTCLLRNFFFCAAWMSTGKGPRHLDLSPTAYHPLAYRTLSWQTSNTISHDIAHAELRYELITHRIGDALGTGMARDRHALSVPRVFRMAWTAASLATAPGTSQPPLSVASLLLRKRIPHEICYTDPGKCSQLNCAPWSVVLSTPASMLYGPTLVQNLAISVPPCQLQSHLIIPAAGWAKAFAASDTPEEEASVISRYLQRHNGN